MNKGKHTPRVEFFFAPALAWLRGWRQGCTDPSSLLSTAEMGKTYPSDPKVMPTLPAWHLGRMGGMAYPANSNLPWKQANSDGGLGQPEDISGLTKHQACVKQVSPSQQRPVWKSTPASLPRSIIAHVGPVRDGRRVSIADTRQRVRMAPFPQKVGGYPGIPKDTRGRLEGNIIVLFDTMW
jgi:hypothetical protein